MMTVSLVDVLADGVSQHWFGTNSEQSMSFSPSSGQPGKFDNLISLSVFRKRCSIRKYVIAYA